MVEMSCEVCGKPFLAERSKVLKGTRKVCSKSCRGLRARSSQPKHIGRRPSHGACVGGKIKRTYRIWSGIKRRCLSKSCDLYGRYGAKGIGVCDEWKNSYQKFEAWALSNGYSDNLQCDRIDNDKGYSPENCRWVTPEENCANRRNSILLLNGETTKTVAKRLGITQSTLRNRIKIMKLSKDQASTMPKLFGGQCKFFETAIGKWKDEA